MAPSDRNDPSTGISKVGGTDLSWMEQYQGDQTQVNAALDDYKILPRLKLIQGLSDQKLQDEFGVGAVVLSPGNVLVAKKQQPFTFTPVFFFPEFLKCSDREDTASLFIVARSFDPTSEIALRARDPEKRTEGYGEKNAKGEFQYHYTYVEVLNFPGFITQEDHDLRGVPMVLVFAKGEFTKGRALIQALSLRRVNGKKVPMFLQRWKLSSGLRERGTRRWWGLDFENPAEPYVAPDHVPFLSGQAKDLEEFFRKEKLRVAGDVEEETPGGTDVEM